MESKSVVSSPEMDGENKPNWCSSDKLLEFKWELNPLNSKKGGVMGMINKWACLCQGYDTKLM